MKKILAMAGSNSSQSINKKLAVYAAGLVGEVEVVQVDLNDFVMPLFSPDLLAASGLPDEAQRLYDLIGSVDGIVLSLAEYNSTFTAAFKNVFDWMSTIDRKVWHDIPMLLTATSPGKGGAQHVLASGEHVLPFYGGNIIATFSLPSFNETFAEQEITQPDLRDELQAKVEQLTQAIHAPKIPQD
jgi:NAD(P)H-dependent FMN reductase